jgi:hypothetical protein
MKKLFINGAATAAVLLLIANGAFAAETNVRGRIVAGDGATPYPSVSVALLNAQGQGPTVYTDRQGMFRINAVAPGSYTLRVTTPRSKKTFNVTAERKEYTDLAPVSVP